MASSGIIASASKEIQNRTVVNVLIVLAFECL